MSISVEQMALLHEHLTAAGDSANHPIQAEIDAARRRAARDGMGGGFVRAIVAIYEQANQRVATGIVQEIRTLCTTLHMPLGSGDIESLQSLALSALLNDARGDSILRANIPASFSENVIQAGNDLIAESNIRLRPSVARDVRLFVLQHIAARESMGKSAGGNTFNIQGNVGVLQAGDRTTAHVHQGLSGDEISKIVHQFAIVIAELHKISPDHLPNRDALVQEVQACESGVREGKPDAGRIKTLVTDIFKGGIGVVQNAPALIAGVQAIAAAFGFQLPGA
ncbi:hypothetical protein [Cupriavidus sp. D39]|uniref:hypothetical protein n=1 Tax=Cupriavidus sp. D39 TaxID=2997877 RepID=UPI00227113B2|nr:hypothetical protein [Cupriavidus sp. D39]MCY0855750.1 hypothetical protein [Cupriavidus sp. D39]